MPEQTKPWLEHRLPIGNAVKRYFVEIPMARDLPYLGTLGALIAGTLAFLVLSGFVLSVYYIAAEGSAFNSIQFIMRQVNFGWLILAFHSTGTSLIFALVYLTIFRAMLAGHLRAPGEVVWFLKLAILLVLLLAGYLGYTLADGAASYWSLQSTTIAAARLGGAPGAIGEWFFGGPAGDGTLARVLALHIALALVLVLLLALHLAAKRAVAAAPGRVVGFHPHYTSQYFVSFVAYALVFAVLVFFAPHLGQNPLNAVPASPLVVPAVLTPPWYLLPVSALSAVVPGTLGGIFAVIAAFAALAALPWLDRSAGTPKLAYKILIFILALDVIILSLAAAAPPSLLTGILSVVCTGWYFLHFLVLTPLVTAAEWK
jgi:quinol-cytochrome oxidoreductase complex cytochrome b subunit